ncbi:response regulator transcription factor [Sphingobium sp. 3R8]|uniref:winged helix-turn-helix transcriptional regulator n=1 Tax=Sphingobium sp. 3R8 TaxID=2874921 RepID=UPI001CCF672E|nr:response regulator transcription factor [Sphingobium sp. 3R8]MBZ9649761.1 response regulator transcription factor [Sphingobium sp. 3R8]
MRSLKPYRPFRFPLYPGRISTLHRAPKTDLYPSRCGQPSALPISGQDMKSGRLMIIEHEENRSRALAALLQSWGFLTVTHADSACKSQRFNQNICDLVLLNGVFNDDIYAQFLSATKSLGQSILIFSQNMDDYKRLKILCDASGAIIPPDWEAEALRRKIGEAIERPAAAEDGVPSTAMEYHLYCFSGWTIDMNQHLVVNEQGESIILSPGDFALLRVFVTYPRRVLSRNQILDLTTAMGSDVTDRVIDTQICRLRRRLMAGHNFIRTVRNEGYMFTERVRRIPPA